MTDTATALNAGIIFDAALASLLRSTTDLESGNPLSITHGPGDVSPEAKRLLRQEIEEFLDEYSDDLHEALNSGTGYTQENIGQDIALTRNHHGAGFWDRGVGPVGARLTEAAHSLGSFELFATADGSLCA